MLPKEAEYAHAPRLACQAQRCRAPDREQLRPADMVAKVIQGMPVKRVMEWGQDQVALAVRGQLKASG
jgi:hypothetical protein